MTDMFSLKGKNAIVTGAGKKTGLCYAMAKGLHDAGAKVVLFDVSPSVFDLCESEGGEAAGYYAVQADLTKEDTLKEGFDKAIELLGGRVDILLNGAGVQYRDDAFEFPREKWDFVISVNLSATFFMAQLAARNMKEHGGGKIINIASMCSFVASKNIPAYSASKGGVAQLTKALSNEWAAHGINVNAIAPGYMLTELTANVKDTEVGRMHTSRIPMGRWGNPEDLAGPVVFLASPASDYMSGAIVPVDGGYLGL